MKNYFVSHDKFAWKWKAQPSFGWTYFSNNVSDKKSMIDYLTLQGKLDPVSISFVTNDLRPAMIFEVRRKDGKTVVNAGEKQIPLYDFEFFDTTESFQYFQEHTTPEIIEKADRISGKIERLQFYKKSADDETLNNYRTMVAERMTDDAIRNKFQNYEPGLQSEILFVE